MTWLLRCFAAVYVLQVLPISAAGVDAYLPPTKFRNETQLLLTDQEQKLLASKTLLKIGFSQPEDLPFDQLLADGSYNGVSAEYSSLLAFKLNMAVKVIRYNNRDDAIHAIKSGEIDLLSTSNQFETDQGLVLSAPYAYDKVVMVHTTSNSQKIKAGAKLRIAIRDDYLPIPYVQSAFKDAYIKSYASSIEALNAVHTGAVDLYLTNVFNSYFLQKAVQASNLKTELFTPFVDGGIGFAIAPKNSGLLELVNRSLNNISQSTQLDIAYRWDLAQSAYSFTSLPLSHEEQHWLKQNPVIKVLVSTNSPPFVFRDQEGELRGLTIDMLKRLGQIIGITFEFTDLNSIEQMYAVVTKDPNVLLGAFTSSNERAEFLAFSKPYFYDVFSIITKKHLHLDSKDGFAKKKITILKGNSIKDYLTKTYPQSEISEVNSVDELMADVVEGRSDAGVNTFLSSKYHIAKNNYTQLKVAAFTGDNLAQIAFATNRHDQQLLSLLNKGLDSIHSEEFNDLNSKWLAEAIFEESYWKKHASVLNQIAIFVIVILFVSSIWILLLQRQVKRRKKTEKSLQEQIAERLRLQQDLELAYENAESASQAKTDFVTNISHEIRTPLNVIAGNIELLVEMAKNKQSVVPLLTVTQNATRSLLGIIGDVLDVKRIESGIVELLPEDVLLKNYLQEQSEIFRSYASQKQLAFYSELNVPNELVVCIDQTRLTQVLSNILANAIKFTAQGVIEFKCTWDLGTDDFDGVLQVSIKDTGIGIPEDELGSIFSPFFQATNSGTSAIKGTGLGLHICKQILGLMGARLELKSKVNVGTEFLLYVPMIKSNLLSKMTKDVLNTEPPERKRILIVDDYKANRTLLKSQLITLGHTVIEAYSATEAFDLYLKELPDAIITDCNMPNISGYDFCKMIRRAEETSGTKYTSVIAYTADASPHVKDLCSAAGMDYCLIKPVLLEKLALVLADTPKHLTGSFDMNSLVKVTNNNPLLFKQLKQDLLEGFEQDIEHLIKSESSVERYDIFHRVLGPARVIHAEHLIQLCNKVQRDKERDVAVSDLDVKELVDALKMIRAKLSE